MKPQNMNRRKFLKTMAAATAGVVLAKQARPVFAALPKVKITKVSIYDAPNPNRLFNQSNMVVLITTDNGIIGVGEGGSKDTLEQCAGRLIGRNPFDIEAAWQDMYRSFFYPPGREKIHALGALDMALWDIKAKALDVPVYELLGGMNRKHVECYQTGGGGGGTVKDQAARAIQAGYRAYRMDAASLGRGNTVYESHERVRQVIADCKAAREGVGKDGDWLIDLHQRFDFIDAVHACKGMEEYELYLAEDPVRTEAFLEDIPKLRLQTSVPIAAGEEWGQRWDFNKLVENHDLDYIRTTLPNVGGISEMHKIAAMCETHFVGIVPHFTGPISSAALIHVLGPFAGPCMMEYNFGAGKYEYLPELLDFKEGKLWPNQRPGLGVKVDPTKCKLLLEVTEFVGGRTLYFRPDGSMTNW